MQIGAIIAEDAKRLKDGKSCCELPPHIATSPAPVKSNTQQPKEPEKPKEPKKPKEPSAISKLFSSLKKKTSDIFDDSEEDEDE